MNKVLVVDNGSYTIKVGYSGEELPRKDKIYKSDQIFGLNEYFSYSPFSEGLLLDISMESDIWEYIFNKMNISPEELGILVTEPFLNPTSLQHSLFEVIFEQFGFNSAIVTNSPAISQFAFSPQLIPKIDQRIINPCYLILDCGYQCCFSVPLFQGSPIYKACRRLDIGGYHLDLALKNFLSFRQVDLSRNSLIVSKIKESCCYISKNFDSDINRPSQNKSDNLIEQIYQLPELKSNSKNSNYYFQECISPENTELLKLNDNLKLKLESEPNANYDSNGVIKLYSERIAVPELLFNPSNGGYNFAGIAEMVSESILSSPKHLQELLANNILIIGGSTKFRNFEARLNKELSSLLPSVWEIKTRCNQRPDFTTWMGGSIWGETNFSTFALSKSKYNEI
ncbi:actin-like protein [Cryptosporidium ubiquitum]|uniref:Actin-like protein n=1 Tax=Cryptosporidium ubiquitum TaxID=857276 RepID=A0A1J4MQL5_9CRYT|nr:actin-like protein [Cryptosporidium ubiquitum]OII75300.1 actin-like protein [Cryptosporidium ubiquitum]